VKHARRTDQPAPGAAPTTHAPTVPPQRTGETPVGEERVVERHERDDRDVRDHHDDAHDKFGGMNLGADFFGWLVAVGVAALLIGIVGAIATAVGANLQLSQAEARQDAGGYGLAAAIVLAVILMIAYYAGGYVAGRMSRFDGARQGLGVWLVGLVIAIVVAVVGAVAGSQYDVFNRVDLPSISLSADTLTWAGLITLGAILVLTLLAAIGGGIVGHRYHNRVDHAAGLY
jgi:hypothetical protein